MGKSQRVKGEGGEREAVTFLPGSHKISRMYQPGPDLTWLSRYVEVRRRATEYQSLNKVKAELDSDASFYMTRLDYGEWLMVTKVDTLLDIVEEAYNRGFNREAPWPE